MKYTFACLGFFIVCNALNAQTNLINLQQFSSGYYQPLDIENCGDTRLFIVQQNGKIFICSKSGVKKTTPYLNISDRVDTAGNSQGLLGLAFDPNYLTNGYFYVNYINSDGHTQISRFSVSSGNPDKANAASEKFILQIQQPYRYHNGGCMRFGVDGYLYIGTGDGDDETGDPNDYAQNTQSFLGKMLRIDVHKGDPYKVPKSNPFVNSPDILHEIWNIGLRNPWRWSFDAVTHDLIIADVGQDNWEEINVQPANSKGGENYGWRCYEGDHAFNTAGCKAKKKYTFPVSEYSHAASTGDCSVTGGFVYRGSAYTALYGKYFYADFCSGIIRMFDIDDPSTEQKAYYGHQHAYTSFGENQNHELFITDFSDGNIYRITSSSNLQQNVSNVPTLQQFKVYPNPAKQNFSVSFLASKEESYTLSFYNAFGEVAFVSKKLITPGLNNWNINVPAAINGNCYFTLSSASGIFVSQKILINKL